MWKLGKIVKENRESYEEHLGTAAKKDTSLFRKNKDYITQVSERIGAGKYLP